MRASSEQVVECAPLFSQDELPGFESATLELPSEGDGPLAATLIRTLGPENDPRPAVLYVHGFVDYFFQRHLAAAFESAGFRFYALELRRYGRSIRPGNRCCMAWHLDSYFTELDWAVQVIKTSHGVPAGLVAHSTGALISALFLRARDAHSIARSLVVNSPFLRFNLKRADRVLLHLVARLGRYAPEVRLPQRLPSTYGKTLHKSERGEWDYDLNKKPLDGFPLYAGWFHMIQSAHQEVEKGLSLPLPVLSLHSDQSRFARREPVDADFEADLVLNVAHIRELSPRLGPNVTLREIPKGVHDLTLSRLPTRELAVDEMVRFVTQHNTARHG